jgi:hypothetical protein
VPVLTLAFDVPPLFVTGASIASVIATSSGSASTYVRENMTNLRIGMFLELVTTTGAMTGAVSTLALARAGHENVICVVFGVVLISSVLPLLRKIGEELPSKVTLDYISSRLELNGGYHDQAIKRKVSYQVTRSPLALAIMYVAGFDLWAARDRERRLEGDCNGRRDEAPNEGILDHEELYDWRHGGGEHRDLLPRRLHQPLRCGPGHDRRGVGIHSWGEDAGEVEEHFREEGFPHHNLGSRT